MKKCLLLKHTSHKNQKNIHSKNEKKAYYLLLGTLFYIAPLGANGDVLINHEGVGGTLEPGSYVTQEEIVSAAVSIDALGNFMKNPSMDANMEGKTEHTGNSNESDDAFFARKGDPSFVGFQVGFVTGASINSVGLNESYTRQGKTVAGYGGITVPTLTLDKSNRTSPASLGQTNGSGDLFMQFVTPLTDVISGGYGLNNGFFASQNTRTLSYSKDDQFTKTTFITTTTPYKGTVEATISVESNYRFEPFLTAGISAGAVYIAFKAGPSLARFNVSCAGNYADTGGGANLDGHRYTTSFSASKKKTLTGAFFSTVIGAPISEKVFMGVEIAYRKYPDMRLSYSKDRFSMSQTFSFSSTDIRFLVGVRF